jgi:16S rRNA (adenine1518-N6/adenine1519-N6)-dimethyltransferase
MVRSVAEVRKIFKEFGLAPKKWMGQNLLVDTRYLHQIVDAAKIELGQAIVEVGAGLGILTQELAARGAKVWALEVDSGFFRVLEEKFGDDPHVKLVHEDALKFDFSSLANEVGNLRVVANLPYSISSRLIFRFHENRDIFSSLHILLQKEVADRLVAEPATKEYGVLTALLGVSAVVDLLFQIPPKAFFPVPEVTSTLVRITFPQPPPVSVRDPHMLTRLVKSCFSGRRKTLRNTLRNAPLAGISRETLFAAANRAEIDLARRGETLSPREFARFADEVHAGTTNSADTEGTPG